MPITREQQQQPSTTQRVTSHVQQRSSDAADDDDDEGCSDHHSVVANICLKRAEWVADEMGGNAKRIPIMYVRLTEYFLKEDIITCHKLISELLKVGALKKT